MKEVVFQKRTLCAGTMDQLWWQRVSQGKIDPILTNVWRACQDANIVAAYVFNLLTLSKLHKKLQYRDMDLIWGKDFVLQVGKSSERIWLTRCFSLCSAHWLSTLLAQSFTRCVWPWGSGMTPKSWLSHFHFLLWVRYGTWVFPLLRT